MEIISRKKAKERGLILYFTGKPCKYGHVSQRTIISGNCYECNLTTHSETKRAWRKTNKKFLKDLDRRGANREKHLARLALQRAVRNGSIKKEPCLVCGSVNVHGHHDDYSKRLEVVWLCPKHHKERHRQMEAQ